LNGENTVNAVNTKYKKLAVNTAVFAVGSFGAKFLSFFLVRLYTGVMSESDFGQADLLQQTINILYPLVTLACADAVIRYGIDKAYDNSKVLTSALIVTLSGLFVFALLTPVLNTIDEFYGLTFLAYASSMFSCFRHIAGSFCRAQGNVKLFAADGIFATLTIVLFNVLFLVVLDMGVTGYILSLVCSDFLSTVFLTIGGKIPKFLDFSKVTRKFLREMIKYSLPLVPAYLLWWITATSDRWFILEITGPEANGIYSAAYKIPGLLVVMTTLFFQAWQMSAIENKDDKGLTDFFGKIYNNYSSILFIAAAGLIMICRPANIILLDSSPEKGFDAAYRFTAVLIIATVFQCFCQFLSSVYNVKNKNVNSMLTSALAAGANLILNAVLIPPLGALGAAIATLASYGLCFISRIIDCTRLIKFPTHNIRFIVNTLLVTFACFALYVNLSGVGWVYTVAVFIAVCLINLKALFGLFYIVIKRLRRKTANV
jgi:O-antigen/teichoic acid export membrane protein